MFRRFVFIILPFCLIRVTHPNRKNNFVLTSELRKLVNAELATMYRKFDKEPGKSMTLSCRSQTSMKIADEYPYAEMRWKHNGVNFKLQPIRMVYSMDSITVNSLNPLDSGTYHCQMDINENVHVIAAVYSVVVGDLTERVPHGGIIVLKCNSAVFGKLYRKAIRYWKNPNGTVVFPKSASANEEIIHGVRNRMNGTWTCYVKDMATQRLWKTARIKVIVEPVPYMSKRIRLYIKSNKIKSFIVIAILVFVTVYISNTCVRFLDKRNNKFKDELEQMQESLGVDITELQQPLLDGETTGDEAESQV